MKTWFAFAAVASAFLAAGPASAQQDPVAYQNELLGRAMSQADTQFCSANAKSSAEYDKCHVTRNFVIDINTKGTKVCPPMAHIEYSASEKEYQQISDRCT
jgi:hypothetical protein